MGTKITKAMIDISIAFVQKDLLYLGKVVSFCSIGIKPQ